MTFEQVLTWCRNNSADARGIYRAKDLSIRQSDQRLPDNLPALGEIFHWDVQLGDLQLVTSASDMERLVSGKMTLEEFKGTHRRG
ncbi:MAG: hypothetical protein GEU77_03055 [Deltaproteobacteria bacterium]|nr:hypothetical protein [Deltaproteobacteria bacterium]